MRRANLLKRIKSMLTDVHKIVKENVGIVNDPNDSISEYIENNAGPFLDKGLLKLNISELEGVIFILEQLTRRA